ncbi:low temperature requirement protein A [Actinomycetospora termitidis]|uniref:Low temperature requirement protein A n=1 Tax=Actinomycetospora termitidis TaxID=3053470 RepID=A0ABT7M1U3_9PSEU|nr:low temperature requirement protein A [Actinomycetospora sp. Odt1-22]MDL5154625.1 low temperature requirement protein A [Actinomycetospora sp. Odt1-22]
MTSPRTEWRRPMRARDPQETHRAASPLELLFDLAFVVAIARAAAELHHAIAENHVGAGLLSYLLVFFAIWWSWINFTWFASAYDCDDAAYRALALLKMAGVLVLAVGVPDVFRGELGTVILGYTIMRVAMVALWLRAAAGDPSRTQVCRTYALGLTVLQVLWVLLLLIPSPWVFIGVVVLIVAEVSLPPVAENRGPATPWHPEHIAERYGLLTLIVLGEVILGITNAFAGALNEGGFSFGLLAVGLGGLFVVAGLWWIYFLGGDEEGLTSLRVALTWGYGHYFVFGAVAAVGGGIEAAVDVEEHIAHVSPVVAAFSVAVPIAIVLVVLTLLRRLTWASGSLVPGLAIAGAVGVLVCAGLAGLVGDGIAILLMGLVLIAMLVAFLLVQRRRSGVHA